MRITFTTNATATLLLLATSVMYCGCSNNTKSDPSLHKKSDELILDLGITNCAQKEYYSQIVRQSDSLGILKGVVDFKQIYEQYIAVQPCLHLPEISQTEPEAVTEASYILQHTQTQQDSLLALLSFSSILPYEMYPRKAFIEFAQNQANIDAVIDSAKDGGISGNCGDFAYLQQQIYNQYMPTVKTFLLQTSIQLSDSLEMGHMVNMVCVINKTDTILYLVDPTTNTSYWDDNSLLTFQQLIGKLGKRDHEDIESKQAKRLIPQRASFPGYTSTYIAFWPVSSPAYAIKGEGNTLIYSNRDEDMWQSLAYTKESYLEGLEKAGMPADWLYMYWYKNPHIKLTLHTNGNSHWKSYFNNHFPEIKVN